MTTAHPLCGPDSDHSASFSVFTGFLTHDQYHALLTDHGINLSKSSEDYYQLFSKFDGQLRDQFDYTDLCRTFIANIMS